MKIAAGEVVTSAGSVVKELIENALDSGASFIKLEIKNGGKDSIKVSDDGSGISNSDIHMAVQPHATSKIERWDDILNLDTFGFRGEALSSIASVSEFYISSKTSGDDVGLSLFFRGGSLGEEKKISMNTGTTIEVRNLFYNVPARRKFLKSSASESRYVLDVLEKFLLARPDVGFEFIRDSNSVYKCMKEPLSSRIQTVLKVNDSKDLLELNHQQGSFCVRGSISSPQVSRPNMTGITAFVNSRYVKDPVVYAAVRDFFTPMLGKGRYPLAVLFLEIPKSEVDINVHPQKLEVKYSDGSAVYSLIKNALKSAFSNHSMEIRESFSNSSIREKTDRPKSETNIKAVFHSERNFVKDLKYEPYRDTSSKSSGRDRYDQEAVLHRQPFLKQAGTDKQTVFSTDKVLGIVKKRYVVTEDDSGLILIDFHAAHERVLYEKIRNKEKKLQTQKLLEPLEMDLDLASGQILRDKRESFAQLGFDYELFNKRTKITGIPNLIRQTEAREVFTEIINEFRLTDLEKESEVFDNVYATIACHNAFRTGDFITIEQAEDLLKEMKTYNVFSCPHGRPVKYKLPFSQLDSYFKRS